MFLLIREGNWRRHKCDRQGERLYDWLMTIRESKAQEGETANRKKVEAVIWDYDGTLVDTRRKNLQVTRALLPVVSGRAAGEFPGLASLEAYEAANRGAANWGVLYGREFGLSDRQVDEAGRLWTRYQLQDQTPAPFFSGIVEALARLEGLPQAIFSQGSRAAIERALNDAGLARYVGVIAGYEEVGPGQQKPAPDGLLFCLRELGVDQGIVFFVGDHDTDIVCAGRANVELGQMGLGLEVVAIGTEFGRESRPIWSTAPDHVAGNPLEVAALVEGYNSG